MHIRILGARIVAFATLSGHLGSEQARVIHSHFVENGVRVTAGDQSLHSVIDANGDAVNRAAAAGDVLAVALQGARKDQDHGEVHDLDWAKGYNTTRSIQLHSNKEVIAGCHEHSHNSPVIQNYLNQGVLNFTCSTKTFKHENAIPQSAPVVEYMTAAQIGLRLIGQQKYIQDMSANTMTSSQGDQRMREIRDKSMEFASFMGLGGLRKRTADVSFAREAVKIEAKSAKKTQRQLKIDLKQRAIDEDACATMAIGA